MYVIRNILLTPHRLTTDQLGREYLTLSPAAPAPTDDIDRGIEHGFVDCAGSLWRSCIGRFGDTSRALEEIRRMGGRHRVLDTEVADLYPDLDEHFRTRWYTDRRLSIETIKVGTLIHARAATRSCQAGDVGVVVSRYLAKGEDGVSVIFPSGNVDNFDAAALETMLDRLPAEDLRIGAMTWRSADELRRAFSSGTFTHAFAYAMKLTSTGESRPLTAAH